MDSSISSVGKFTSKMRSIVIFQLFCMWLICLLLSFVIYPLAVSAEEWASIISQEEQATSESSSEKKATEYDISDISDDDLNSIKTGDNFAAQDDLEGFNRAMFSFNLAVDNVLIKPVATVYGEVVPQFPKNRVADFLSNLHEPIYFLNHLLQFNPEGAGDALGRFLFNSTFGLLGLMDIATEAGISRKETDFGLTLKHYGIDNGSYLVLPIIGPSSLRDAPSLIIDTLTDPFNSYKVPRWAKITRYSTELVSKRERSIKLTDQLESTSLDYYATVRSIYLQKR